MNTHYLSSAVLRRDASSMALIQLLSPTDRGLALNTQHQLVWSLFANDASASDKRRFIWREDNNCFFILSEKTPVDSHNLFDIKTTAFTPQIEKDSTCRFRLRSNATICRTVNEGSKRKQKRHDLVMDQIHAFERSDSSQDRAALREQAIDVAAKQWLTKLGEKSGFALKELIDAQYSTVRIPRKNARKAQLGILDLEGFLTVENPDHLLSSIPLGFGRAKAFGCGLMLTMTI